MGRLVNLSDLDLDASWYFPDAYYARERNSYIYNWPNAAYPHGIGIHQDDISISKKIAIRKWIEENLVETVICNAVDNSYRRFVDTDQTWERSYEVSNRWLVFYFDNEQSATMFALRFSEWIKPVTKEHPEYMR